jgi:hypothetical protein
MVVKAKHAFWVPISEKYKYSQEFPAHLRKILKSLYAKYFENHHLQTSAKRECVYNI